MARIILGASTSPTRMHPSTQSRWAGRLRGRELFRAVRWYIVAAAVTATAAALIFAIYFTQAGLPWIFFLTGILVAAVFAEAVHVSRSEWVVMRRTAQVSSLKDKL